MVQTLKFKKLLQSLEEDEVIKQDSGNGNRLQRRSRNQSDKDSIYEQAKKWEKKKRKEKLMKLSLSETISKQPYEPLK